jgi:hypothetical protein
MARRQRHRANEPAAEKRAVTGSEAREQWPAELQRFKKDGRSMKQAQQENIYQLKISLKDLRPLIWRRIQVQSGINLAKLHRILQATMGWYDSHLHQFIVGGTYYGVPSRDEFLDKGLRDERQATLNRILSKPKQKMIYEYDFGDGWEHEILLENVLAPEAGARYPRCIGGARACPPEDCGGTAGYENFLAAIRDPNHEEHDEYLEWIGGEFDPEEFDLADFDATLRHVR